MKNLAPTPGTQAAIQDLPSTPLLWDGTLKEGNVFENSEGSRMYVARVEDLNHTCQVLIWWTSWDGEWGKVARAWNSVYIIDEIGRFGYTLICYDLNQEHKEEPELQFYGYRE